MDGANSLHRLRGLAEVDEGDVDGEDEEEEEEEEEAVRVGETGAPFLKRLNKQQWYSLLSPASGLIFTPEDRCGCKQVSTRTHTCTRSRL